MPQLAWINAKSTAPALDRNAREAPRRPSGGAKCPRAIASGGAYSQENEAAFNPERLLQRVVGAAPPFWAEPNAPEQPCRAARFSAE
jgi:hypothetical protein